MSLPNQHQSLLTISQNEDLSTRKQTPNSHCSVNLKNEIEQTSNNLEINSELKDVINNEVVESNEIEIEDTNKNLKDIDLKEISIITNSGDEQVVQCEIAFNLQELALISPTNQNQNDLSVLIIDEDQCLNELNNESNNELNDLHSLSKSDQANECKTTIKLDLKSNLNNELNSQSLVSKSNNKLTNESTKEELAKKTVKESSKESCTTLKQTKSSTNELNEDYLLNSSTINNTTVDNCKSTLNSTSSTNSINLNNSTSVASANKRKIEQLHIVACRKSARLHELQSYHSDNSIYLFESLKKRSASISSTNSTDLARYVFIFASSLS